MKKKVGTVLDERLFFEAKKASLEDQISFHRLLEKALEKYLGERVWGKAAVKSGRVPRIAEKEAAYQAYGNIPGAERPARSPFSITPEERWQRALSLSGKFRSGRSDVSSRHDEFAAEAYGK